MGATVGQGTAFLCPDIVPWACVPSKPSVVGFLQFRNLTPRMVLKFCWRRIKLRAILGT